MCGGHKYRWTDKQTDEQTDKSQRFVLNRGVSASVFYKRALEERFIILLLHNIIYLLDAYHPSLESHQHCHRHLPCPEVRKVIAVVLVVHLQEEPVAQELGWVAAAAVEVSAELAAGPVVHQQLEMVAAAAALLVVDISPQEYPSIISLLLVYNIQQVGSTFFKNVVCVLELCNNRFIEILNSLS